MVREPVLVLQTNSYNFCRCSVIRQTSNVLDHKPGEGIAPRLGDGEAGTGGLERWLVGLAGSDPATVELWEFTGLVRSSLSENLPQATSIKLNEG